MKMYSQVDFFETAASVRRPIQCEGIARGPERMAEVAVSGSVNPQFGWGDVANIAKTVGPALLGLL
jgi:hypothetical protein